MAVAQAACAALDNLNIDNIVGTLAGDDTIFVLCKDENSAFNLKGNLEKITKEKPEHPAERYKKKNKKNLPLLQEGLLDFCKFKLQNAKDVCGVYAWVINNKIVYIGETVNFKKHYLIVKHTTKEDLINLRLIIN